MRVAFPELEVRDLPWTAANAEPPPHGRLVRYRTACYEMIGYLDLLGRWIGLDGLAEDLPVEGWRELHA